jgi:hypothetical protein
MTPGGPMQGSGSHFGQAMVDQTPAYSIRKKRKKRKKKK